MITVSRCRHIDAAPASVFAALADPENLAGIMPRVRRVEIIDQRPDRVRIATHMSFPLFGDIRTEGDVHWRRDCEVVFMARWPLPVEARWTLTPSKGGTKLQAALALDLAPLIGPLAALVPRREVASMIGPDLDAALAEIARRVERCRERAVAE